MVAATWTLGAHEAWHPDIPASLHGTFGAGSAHLQGWFHLDADSGFSHGTVEGDISGQPVAASNGTAPYTYLWNDPAAQTTVRSAIAGDKL